jgi:hypothetical protein
MPDVTIVTSSPYQILTCKNEFDRFCNETPPFCWNCTLLGDCISFTFWCDYVKYKGDFCSSLPTIASTTASIPTTTTPTTTTSSTSTTTTTVTTIPSTTSDKDFVKPCDITGAFDLSDVIIVEKPINTSLSCASELSRICNSLDPYCFLCEQYSGCVSFTLWCDYKKYKGEYCYTGPTSIIHTSPATTTFKIATSTTADLNNSFESTYHLNSSITAKPIDLSTPLIEITTFNDSAKNSSSIATTFKINPSVASKTLESFCFIIKPSLKVNIFILAVNIGYNLFLSFK